jgi:RimJ/RimL family protein N-acetyltransferase
MRLETERLVLRLPRLEDAGAVRELYSDPIAMRFIGGVSEMDTAEVIRRWLERWEENGVGHFAVERREDGRVLGRTGFVVWDTGDWHVTTRAEAGRRAQPELGWALAREHWGCSYATEAARAARDWAFQEAEVEGLVSVIAPENAPSARVAEKLDAVPRETVELAKHGTAVVWEHPR